MTRITRTSEARPSLSPGNKPRTNKTQQFEASGLFVPDLQDAEP